MRRALLAAGLLLGAGPAFAGSPEPARPEWVWEASTYYTSAGLYVPFPGRPIPKVGPVSELQVYSYLLELLRPQLVLFEASFYPAPLAGTWVRDKHPGTYEDLELFGINAVEALTTGFQEPAAVSLFLGSAVQFTKPGEPDDPQNRGHIGYLLSGGFHHIKDNVRIRDHWYEFEWKMQGTRDYGDDDLSWSFRAGTRQHSHPDIADVVHVGLRRSSLNYRAPFLSWLNNSSGEIIVEFVAGDLHFARWDLIAGKKMPFDVWRFALTLELGLAYESPRKYTGVLRDTDGELTLVFRPNIEF